MRNHDIFDRVFYADAYVQLGRALVILLICAVAPLLLAGVSATADIAHSVVSSLQWLAALFALVGLVELAKTRESTS